MFDGFTFNDIKNLSELVSPQTTEGEGNKFYSGELGKSVLNPGNIDGRDKKELAKPFAKIEAKVNNRILKNKETEIFTEQDIKEKDVLVEDNRPKPKFEVLYKQRVGTEDIYLGMSGKDVSSNCCDELVVKISLPGALLKEIALDVKDQSIHLQTPRYMLNHTLQYQINKEKVKAKWDKDKSILEVNQLWEELANTEKLND